MLQCPYCGGRIFVEKDFWGVYFACINCGRDASLERIPQDVIQEIEEERKKLLYCLRNEEEGAPCIKA